MKVEIKSIHETTVGRVLIWRITPAEVGFENINKVLNKKLISKLVDISYRKAGLKKTVIFADQLMYLGFRFFNKIRARL
jgi:DNA-directed RNA polymerase subunit beta'